MAMASKASVAMASSAPHTPNRDARDALLFFATSPLHTHMRASELIRTLPPDFRVDLFTVDKSPSSPHTATERSETTGRRIIASKRSTEVFSGKIDNDKELSNIKALLAEVIKRNDALGDRVKGLEAEVKGLDAEVNLYGGSRKQAVIGLICVLIVILDNEVRRALNHASYHEGFDVCVELMGREASKPFKNEKDVTYTRCYWWQLQHNMLQAGQSFEDLWNRRLGYQTEREQCPLPQQWRTTAESHALASMLSRIMSIAEQAVVSTVNASIEDHSKHLTVDALRDTCGLYITLLLPFRNQDVHLLEKAFSISFDQQPHRPRHSRADSSLHRFDYKPLQLVINEDYLVKSTAVLQDIISNINHLGSLDCIKHVIRGLALFLLACSRGDVTYPAAEADLGWFWSFADESFTYIHRDGTLWEVEASNEGAAQA